MSAPASFALTINLSANFILPLWFTPASAIIMHFFLLNCIFPPFPISVGLWEKDSSISIKGFFIPLLSDRAPHPRPRVKSKSAIFIDVRDSSDIKKTGTILDGLEIPRGLIEFVADEATPLYNENLKKDSEIILVCGVGGQAALAGKTLIEMGYKNVLNVGGIPDWEKNGGPMKK